MVTIRRAKMVARFRTLLAEEGVSMEWAPSLAQKLAAAFWEDYGPGTHYLESLRPHRVQERNARILRSHNGDNVADLARREGLTTRQVQRIVRSKRTVHHNPRTLTDTEKADIRRAFNGSNAPDLARRYGIPVEYVQQIAGARR